MMFQYWFIHLYVHQEVIDDHYRVNVKTRRLWRKLSRKNHDAFDTALFLEICHDDDELGLL